MTSCLQIASSVKKLKQYLFTCASITIPHMPDVTHTHTRRSRSERRALCSRPMCLSKRPIKFIKRCASSRLIKAKQNTKECTHS